MATSPQSKRGARPVVDWEAVERDYRTGVRSLREIAADHGITEGAIRKRAKTQEWSRDLAGKVRAKADELVRKELVRTEVRSEPGRVLEERQVVAIEAEVQARIQIQHRADVPRARRLVLRLLAECEAMAEEPEQFSTLGELLQRADESGGIEKLQRAYQAAISLPARIKGVKDLCDALRVLVELERKVFNIEVASDPDGPNRQLTDVERATRLSRLVDLAKARREATDAKVTGP